LNPKNDLEIFRGLFESRLKTLDHITRVYFANRPGRDIHTDIVIHFKRDAETTTLTCGGSR
jgi:hypothetical protein